MIQGIEFFIEFKEKFVQKGGSSNAEIEREPSNFDAHFTYE